MPELDWIPLTFEKGLNTFDVPSVLEEGQCQVLDNFEWLPNGGITPRPGWRAAGASPTGGPGASNRRARGQEMNWYESGVRKLVEAFAQGGTSPYELHKTNVADPTAFTSYTSIENITITAGFRDDPVRFSVGMNLLVYTNPGFPSQQLRKYDGTTASAVSTANLAGRCILYHLNRFWVGGNPTTPTYLRFSEIGDVDAWNVGENFIPVGQDDGEPIEDMVIWDRGLVIGKQHSLWFLSGLTQETLRLDPIRAGLGVARGRSMVATEHGVFFAGIDGNAYLYDGAEVHLITRNTGIMVAPTNGYLSVAWVNRKLYVTSSADGSTIYSYEPGRPAYLGRWRRETIVSTTTNAADLATFDDRYLVAQPANGSRALSVRQERGAFLAGSGYRDPQPDVGDDGLYAVRTQEFWPKGAFGKASLREVHVRYRQWTAGAGDEPLAVTPYVDGVAGTPKTIASKTAAGLYKAELGFNAAADDPSRTGRNFALEFSFNPTGAENGVYSIEEAWAGVLTDKGRR